MGLEQQVDQWHEFYLALASAAAVLLGPVFIGLSLHLEKAETPRGPMLLGLGSQALINYVYILCCRWACWPPTGRRCCPGLRPWPWRSLGSTTR
jgi:hypothetical protein